MGRGGAAGNLGGGEKDSWVDRLCSLIAFVGLSVPDVLLALLALMFAAATGWLPVGGAQSSLYDLMTPGQQLRDRLHHLILPMMVLAAGDFGGDHAPDAFQYAGDVAAEFVTTRGRREWRKAG